MDHQSKHLRARAEQLLNGLRLPVLATARKSGCNPKTSVLIAGAAFDLSGKAGGMALLGDLLFPDPATVDYFTDEMGGKLDVKVTYDSTTITMVGKAAEFERIVEVLRNAILRRSSHPKSSPACATGASSSSGHINRACFSR